MSRAGSASDGPAALAPAPHRPQDPGNAAQTGLASFPARGNDPLVERAQQQWWEGDWQGLAALAENDLAAHPARERLALLAAVGLFAAGNAASARQHAALAREWGCDRRWISRLALSGMHNSLARAFALLEDESERSREHFRQSISVVEGGPIAPHIATIRQGAQLQQLRNAATATSARTSAPDASESDRPRTRAARRERAAYLNQCGEQLYRAGTYKLAAEYFQRAIDLEPEDAWYWQNLAEAICRLDVPKSEPWECESLGREIAQNGRWDAAVRRYRHALKLSPRLVAAHQDAQQFALAPPHPGIVNDPIFIVGCGHSGTSLMLAMLGEHPLLHPIPKESALFLRTDTQIQKTMQEWDAETRSQGKQRWIEKTPPHVFQIHRFMAFRPGARFLIMLRDGRDVICSLKPRIGYASLEDRIDRWVYDNLAALRYWEHPQVKVVRYEELVADTEQTLRAICEFLGINYTTAMLEYHTRERRWYSEQITRPDEIKSHADHLNTRNWQINQPIFDARGRWISDMDDAQAVVVKASAAQSMLIKFGYVAGSQW